ncbi:hypothetical protein ACA910_004165 [Epithemia clementina (nom. ined.)]
MREKRTRCASLGHLDDNRSESNQGDSLGEEDSDSPGSTFSALSKGLLQNFDVLKKRKISENEATRVARETQAMIQCEVVRMRNAVAELETYLHSVETLVREEEESIADDPVGLAANANRETVVVVAESDDEDGAIDEGATSRCFASQVNGSSGLSERSCRL